MPARRRDLLATLAGIGAAGLAGCTGSNSGGDGEDTTAQSTTQSGAMDTTTEGASVAIPGFEFDPLRLSVAPGATVEWTNEDSTGHNVVAGQFHDTAVAWEFESETIGNGESVAYTFEESGVYEYYCSIHGKGTMSGAVLVGDVSLDQQLPSEDDGGY